MKFKNVLIAKLVLHLSVLICLFWYVPSSHAISNRSYSIGEIPKDLSLADLLNLDVSVATKSVKMSESSAPSIVSVITQREIRNMGAKTLEEVLTTIAGFDINRHNHYYQAR